MGLASSVLADLRSSSSSIGGSDAGIAPADGPADAKEQEGKAAEGGGDDDANMSDAKQEQEDGAEAMVVVEAADGDDHSPWPFQARLAKPIVESNTRTVCEVLTSRRGMSYAQLLHVDAQLYSGSESDERGI